MVPQVGGISTKCTKVITTASVQCVKVIVFFSARFSNSRVEKLPLLQLAGSERQTRIKQRCRSADPQTKPPPVTRQRPVGHHLTHRQSPLGG
jgi:hypothetical protein